VSNQNAVQDDRVEGLSKVNNFLRKKEFEVKKQYERFKQECEKMEWERNLAVVE